jgi:cbb3-type cytochrome oxidase subunit 3
MGRFIQGLVDPVWAQFALVFFLVFFVAVVAWVYWPARRRAYEEASQLPLNEKND